MNRWEEKGRDPESRAMELYAAMLNGRNITVSDIVALVAAAVEEEREACAALLLREAGACQTEAEQLGIATEDGIRRGMIRDTLRGMAADIRARSASEGESNG